MSKKEVDDAIFKFERPAKIGFKSGKPQYVSTELPPEQKGEALCFDLCGMNSLDEVKCAAKYVTSASHSKISYFIKWCLDGPDKGHPLNPYSIYFKEGDEDRLDNKRGTKRYEFREVNENSFNLYLSFLRTRIVSYCQAAEREVLNG